MFCYARAILNDIEKDNAVDSRAAAIQRLRALALNDYLKVFWTFPDPAYPKLSSLLPVAASEKVQREWSGGFGLELQVNGVEFVWSVACRYMMSTGRQLAEANVLDYGCGYGRYLRAFTYFVDEKQLVGIDPWQRSISECEASNLANVWKGEWLPLSLPLPITRQYDLIYSYSFFTHMSERAALVHFGVLGKHLSSGGLLAVTIRPVEFWRYISEDDRMRDELERQHRDGFAFRTHNRLSIDGGLVFGDASISLGWIRKNLTQFQIIGLEHSLRDTMELVIFLRHKNPVS